VGLLVLPAADSCCRLAAAVLVFNESNMLAMALLLRWTGYFCRRGAMQRNTQVFECASAVAPPGRL
jgi:hypothetical protein